jgi:hypothetical protein
MKTVKIKGRHKMDDGKSREEVRKVKDKELCLIQNAIDQLDYAGRDLILAQLIELDEEPYGDDKFNTARQYLDDIKAFCGFHFYSDVIINALQCYAHDTKNIYGVNNG